MDKQSYLAAKLIIIMAISTLFGGCNPKSDTANISDFSKPIIIDATSLKETDVPLRLSQFAESISYIYLSEEPLLGDVKESPIHIIDDTIYIDYDNIYKYTPEGQFVKKLFVVGQGPGEAFKHKMGNNAAFNREGGFITFPHRFAHYVNYSLDGVFLGKSDYIIDENKVKRIETYFKNHCLFRIDHNPKTNNGNRLGSHLFYVEDTRTNSVFYSHPNPVADEKPLYKGGQAIIIPSDMNFIHIDTALWFKHYALDTLYSTQDFITIHPRYIFKTDHTFMNLREYTQLMVYAIDRNRYEAKVINGILPLPTGNLLFTIGKKTALADKTGITSGITEKPLTNDLDHYLKAIDINKHLNMRTFYIDKNHLYILVDAFLFFEEECTPPFKQLTEDSNPVIMKIKLKTG